MQTTESTFLTSSQKSTSTAKKRHKNHTRSPLTKPLHLVHLLIASIIPRPGQPLSVLVGEGAPQAVNHSPGREVLRGDQLKGAPLAVLLAFDDVIQIRVVLGEGRQPGEGAVLRGEKRVKSILG